MKKERIIKLIVNFIIRSFLRWQTSPKAGLRLRQACSFGRVGATAQAVAHA
jgi:hypothetical protein